MIVPDMRNFLQSRRQLTTVLLAISFAVLFGIQAIEASHLHVSGVDYSECAQCQIDTSAVLSEPTQLQSLAHFAAVVAVAYRSLTLNTPYSLSSPRGPPTLSS